MLIKGCSMTQNEIIKMAKLAGWEMDDSCVLEPEVVWYISQGQLETFAELIEAKYEQEIQDLRDEILNLMERQDDSE
jgi:hypothetical protein